MKNLSRVFRAAFFLLLLVGCSTLASANPIGPQKAKYAHEAKGQFSLTGSDLAKPSHSQRAELIPLPFSKQSASVFSSSFNKNHFLFLSVLLSLTLLVLAHKNHFETDIYEFYHRNQEGMVVFESVEAQKAHLMRASLAKLMRLGGILCALTGLGSLIFV